jgi:hypothetical protein
MGQPPGPYGAPGPFPPQYGGPYGAPPPPPKRNLLPWLIVGGAVLLSGVGLLLVVLLTRDDGPSGTQAAASTAPTSASASASRESAAAELPGGARVVEPSSSSARFPGSEQVALTWVQAMADGDFETAYELSCADVQASAAAVDDGSGPAWALGTYFYEQTLGGNGFTEGSFDSIQYSAAADSDVGSFTLQLDSGEAYTLLVYVDSSQKVCDFV